MSVPVKLPAVFTGIASKVDGSYKLTFNTRELGGPDAAALLNNTNKECWLLIAPDDSLDSVDVPPRGSRMPARVRRHRDNGSGRSSTSCGSSPASRATSRT